MISGGGAKPSARAAGHLGLQLTHRHLAAQGNQQPARVTDTLSHLTPSALWSNLGFALPNQANPPYHVISTSDLTLISDLWPNLGFCLPDQAHPSHPLSLLLGVWRLHWVPCFPSQVSIKLIIFTLSSYWDSWSNAFVIIADSKRESTRKAIGSKVTEETQYSKVEPSFLSSNC